MTVTKSDSEITGHTIVCNDIQTVSGGTMVCHIPITYENTSYTAQIYKDKEFLGYKSFALMPTAMDTFGMTGIILSAFAFLMLALMGISSGIAVIIFGIVGLVFVGMLAIFQSGNILGIGSAIVWVVVAGTIIIIKIANRRIS
jgi:hypothetical protein